MKKKILIVITGDLIVRNYLSTDAFSEIIKKFKCYFLASGEGVTIKKYLSKLKNFKGYFFYTKKEKKQYVYFHLKKTFQDKNKSKSMKFGVDRVLIQKIFYYDQLLKNIIFLPIRILSKFKKNITYWYFNIKYFFSPNSYVKLPYSINTKISNVIDVIKPDLVIVPTLGQEMGYYDTIRCCINKKILNLSLIDNWDSMSSRMHPKPHADKYAVWGDQSKSHGQSIQKINKKKIYTIGTPRLDKYFVLRKKKLKSHFKFKYVLFFEGFGVEDDLDDIFDILNSTMNKNKFKYLKAIYRPHPWRKNAKLYDLAKYDNIFLDPQIARSYKENKLKTSFQPNLNYYPSLIKNSELIISSPTTMVLESLIFWKKVLLLGHNPEKLFGHHNLIVKHNHYDGVKNIEGVDVCWDLKNLEKQFISCLNRKKVNKKKIDYQRNYYLFNNNLPYKNRLKNLVDSFFK